MAHDWINGAQIARVPADAGAVFAGDVIVLCAMVGDVMVGSSAVIVIWLMPVEDGVATVLFEPGADELAAAWLPEAALVLATEATEESWRFGFWPGKVNLGREIPTDAH